MDTQTDKVQTFKEEQEITIVCQITLNNRQSKGNSPAIGRLLTLFSLNILFLLIIKILKVSFSTWKYTCANTLIKNKISLN